MSNIISPFQMKHNKVASFNLEQNEVLQELDTTNVSLGADFKISNVQKKDKKIIARLNLLITLTGTTDKNENLFEIKLDMVGVFECIVNKLMKINLLRC